MGGRSPNIPSTIFMIPQRRGQELRGHLHGGHALATAASSSKSRRGGLVDRSALPYRRQDRRDDEIDDTAVRAIIAGKLGRRSNLPISGMSQASAWTGTQAVAPRPATCRGIMPARPADQQRRPAIPGCKAARIIAGKIWIIHTPPSNCRSSANCVGTRKDHTISRADLDDHDTSLGDGRTPPWA